jgi:hypothetical protein
MSVMEGSCRTYMCVSVRSISKSQSFASGHMCNVFFNRSSRRRMFAWSYDRTLSSPGVISHFAIVNTEDCHVARLWRLVPISNTFTHCLAADQLIMQILQNIACMLQVLLAVEIKYSPGGRRIHPLNPKCQPSRVRRVMKFLTFQLRKALVEWSFRLGISVPWLPPMSGTVYLSTYSLPVGRIQVHSAPSAKPSEI